MDSDGHGIRPALLCPYVLYLDCDDTNASIHPRALELCNGNDCNDSNPAVRPGAVEVCDGLDSNCDGGNPCTNDTCVSFACVYTYNTNPCNDGDPCTMNDVCSQGICDGVPLDADNDGFIHDACVGGDDCLDSNPNSNPADIEGPMGEPTCLDGLDNDCDGLADLEELDCIT